MLFCGVRYVTLVRYNTKQQILHHLQTNYLECIKTGRNDSKFTIGKYLINTMEIIKLFRLNIFMLVVKFLRFTIWLFYKMEIIKLSLVNIFVPVTSCINLVLGCVFFFSFRNTSKSVISSLFR